MVYEKNGYARLERELIKRKTKAMKELEEEFKDAQLSFNIKTIYRSARRKRSGPEPDRFILCGKY